MNVYDLLGIDRDADLDAIKRAYRGLAKELHPDVNAGDEKAADRFKEITAAYNMLAGFGIEGFGGAPPGDLNVLIELVPDPSIEAIP